MKKRTKALIRWLNYRNYPGFRAFLRAARQEGYTGIKPGYAKAVLRNLSRFGMAYHKSHLSSFLMLYNILDAYYHHIRHKRPNTALESCWGDRMPSVVLFVRRYGFNNLLLVRRKGSKRHPWTPTVLYGLPDDIEHYEFAKLVPESEMP